MPKNIILCSDGTGNKGGYGEDTNVYKLYKAVDIHNTSHPQITYYDNGVGAKENQNKYVQKLRKAFGFGFQSNISELYQFLALNYNPGDRIYLFGFSRGGATIRAFLGLLYACGLVDRYDGQGKEKNTDHLTDEIDEALKAYEKIPSRKAVDSFRENKALHDKQHVPYGAIPIQFVGVWDTVSALGFPKDSSLLFGCFFNFMDKISDQIWSHNFYDYELNSTIKNAYQALSIDDQRKTFRPMVWDESANDFAGVVEQVWFSGMHSNVGGGYARTGLSDIAMEWMLVRATQQGLIIKVGVEAGFNADADTYDRLYDSREGIAAYYRYEPRDLDELSKTKEKNKLSGKIKVHNTVMQRIKQGTAGYAPALFPYEIDVVETPMKSPTVSVKVANDKTAWQTSKEQILSYINQRKWLYRIFAEFTLAVILISGWMWINPVMVPQDSSESLNLFERFFGHIADVFQYFLPAFFGNFINFIIRVHSWIFVALVAVIISMLNRRKHLKHKQSQASKKLCQQLLQNYEEKT